MDNTRIMRGGWLAGRRPYVAAGVAVAVALGGYLTGDLDLIGFAGAVVQALFGVD